MPVGEPGGTGNITIRALDAKDATRDRTSTAQRVSSEADAALPHEPCYDE